MADIFVESNFYMDTSDACIIDLTPPTFAGINFLDVESRGQIRAGWAAATDPNTPIRYEVYIKASTATGLFNTANIVGITDKLQYDIFTMPDGSFLVNGTTYFVGVRAIDALSNRDANTVSLNVISTGVLTSIDVYLGQIAWSIDQNNQFRLTAWVNKNESLAKSPSAVMGLGAYTVYDNLGNIVSGMSGSGVSANSEGLYVFPAVNSSLDLLNNHYEVRTSIIVDGEARVNYSNIGSIEKRYEVEAAADLNNNGEVIGSFWVSRNGQIATSNLGTGSFEVYTSTGTLLPISQTGITADANGFFIISPTAFTGDVTDTYVIKIQVTVDGELQLKYVTLGNEPAVFDSKAIFSINASNQLEATFWATKNNQLQSGAVLGTASYTIYDKNGAPVSGLSQTGITADSNGYFHITPVSATLLTDLTHYTAKVTINVAGYPRISTRGFTLLGN